MPARAASVITTILLAALPATAQPLIDFTPQGTRFGYTQRSGLPQPTIIVLNGALEHAFLPPYTALTGAFPHALIVSLDLPGHGQDARNNEPGGLWTWLYRINYGEDVVQDAVNNVRDLVASLTSRGMSDPGRIMVAGFSRGAFLALHAVNQGVPISVVGLMPLTDLAALREFAGAEHWEAVQRVKLTGLFTSEQIWLLAGAVDPRVDSARTVAFWETTTAWNPQSRMELHLVPSDGHAVPAMAYPLAVEWISRVWAKPNGGR